jgi:hypothetical protein
MITDVFISAYDPDENDFENGLNVTLRRLSCEEVLTIEIEDDGGKRLFPEFQLELEELKKVVLKLEI